MKRIFSRSGKILAVIVVSVLLALMIFLSPAAKYFVEKNSKEWVGREIRMDKLYLNVFTGRLTVNGLKIFEADDDSVFFSADEIMINTSLYRMLTGSYEVSQLEIVNPYIHVVNYPSGFNFSDLINRNRNPADTVPSDPVNYYIQNIKIINGLIDYSGTIHGIEEKITKINLSSKGISWNDPRSEYNISLSLSTGGFIRSVIDLDLESSTFFSDLEFDDINLGFLTPYMQELINIRTFESKIFGKGFFAGSMDKSDEIAGSGFVGMKDMVLLDPGSDTLMSLGRFVISLDSTNSKQSILDLHHIIVEKPFVKFEMYQNSETNFSELTNPDSLNSGGAEGGSSEENPFVLLAHYLSNLAQSFVLKSYDADSIALVNGAFLYKDFSLLEPFVYDISRLNISSGNVNSSLTKVEFRASAVLNDAGTFEGFMRVDPADYYNMEIFYKIKGVMLPQLSPYSIYYVAYPFEEGSVEYTSENIIRNKILDSKNHVFIESVKVGDKFKHDKAMNLPLKFAVSLLTDAKGNIDLDIPVSGNLDDPDYHIGKVIWQLLGNIITKAASSPYRLLSKKYKLDPSDLNGFNFSYLDTLFNSDQTKSIDALAKVLSAKSELDVLVLQYNDPVIEKEMYASHKMRRIFWNETKGIEINEETSKDQMEEFHSLTVRDSAFVEWIEAKIDDQSAKLPFEEKVVIAAGRTEMENAVSDFEQSRNRLITERLINAGIDSMRFKVYTENPSLIPDTAVVPGFIFRFSTDIGAIIE